MSTMSDLDIRLCLLSDDLRSDPYSVGVFSSVEHNARIDGAVTATRILLGDQAAARLEELIEEDGADEQAS